jgi:hypothetical protein
VLDLDEETFKIGRESYKWAAPKPKKSWEDGA